MLNFFCKIVPEVTANSEIIDAIRPIIGMPIPISNPKTIIVPVNANIIPIHCFHDTSSLRIGPAYIFVKIGCIETINAEILAGNPINIE